MVNSKGGFLVEDEKEATEDLRAKAREQERERAMKNLEPGTYSDRPYLSVRLFFTGLAIPRLHTFGLLFHFRKFQNTVSPYCLFLCDLA